VTALQQPAREVAGPLEVPGDADCTPDGSPGLVVEERLVVVVVQPPQTE